MNTADLTTQPSGFPLTADGTLDFLQQSYLSGIRALAQMAGNSPVIVTGVQRQGANHSDGWIYYEGDLVFFEGGPTLATFIIETTAVSAANENGQSVERYFAKKARFGTGPGQVDFSTLKRAGTLVSLQSQAASVVNFEPAVIVDGAQVSNIVGTLSGTLSISAGTYIIDGQFIETAGYTGSFPVYFNVDGYTTSEPGSGTYVTFDPNTSQRKADVLARALTKPGELKDVAVLSDRFEPSTGLGKWEWAGFALCDGRNNTVDLRGRMRIGHDPRTVDPNNDIWDSAYNTPGANGGDKDVALSLQQMPAHNHTGHTTTVPAGELGLIRRSQVGENVTTSTTDTGSSGVEPDLTIAPGVIPSQGNGESHENRPPFLVTVTVQRLP